MRIRTLLTALLVLPLVAAGAAAQSYTIKIKDHPAAGKIVTVKSSGTTQNRFAILLDGKNLKEEKSTDVEEVEYTETVLEDGPKRPKKFERHYTKAVKGKKGNAKERSYEGKTVLFEREGDKYVVKAKDKSVTEKDLAELAQQVNRKGDEQISLLLPKKAVEINQTWQVEKKGLITLLGKEMEKMAKLDQATATGKLVKAYQKGQQQWGVIELTISMPMTQLGPIPLKKSIPMNAKFVLDVPIDGSSTGGSMKGQMNFKGDSMFEQGGMAFTVELNIQGNFSQSQSAERDAKK